MQLSRRSFLFGDAGPPSPQGLLPPWAATEAACSACGLCVEACPANLISLAQGRLSISFQNGECTFCGGCSAVCPEPVFDKASPAFQHRLSIGPDCLAAEGVACMACADSCPSVAIRLRPRIGGPALPVLDGAACSGCGSCISVCPAGAICAEMPEPVDG